MNKSRQEDNKPRMNNESGVDINRSIDTSNKNINKSENGVIVEVNGRTNGR